MELYEVGWGIVWIDLVHDMDMLRFLVNGVMSPRFP